jgi:8-oxo-dGTP diphosphatase
MLCASKVKPMARRTNPPAAPSDEAAFLASYDPSIYSRPSVAVDLVLATVREHALRVLLVRRGEHPFKGAWALPGGFVEPAESLEEAGERVLRSKAGLSGVFLEQLYTFGSPSRDPRTRVISVAYLALVPAERLKTALGEGDQDKVLARVRIAWKGERGGPAEALDSAGSPLTLAFDHADILGLAVKRLRGKLAYTPIGYELLGREFTLRQLQDVHETILGAKLNKDSFRRHMLASGELHATGKLEEEVGHRPAELYRFAAKAGGGSGGDSLKGTR